MTIRDERPEDAAAIAALTTRAFAPMPYASGTEAAIIAGLRAAGALAMSLVADEGGAIAGHVAFSPVTVRGQAGFFGLGPVSVAPERQGAGIGTALIRAGLARLEALGAPGCVLVGDAGYYGRFGFARRDGLSVAGIPPEHVLALDLAGEVPAAPIVFHPAFDV